MWSRCLDGAWHLAEPLIVDLLVLSRRRTGIRFGAGRERVLVPVAAPKHIVVAALHFRAQEVGLTSPAREHVATS